MSLFAWGQFFSSQLGEAEVSLGMGLRQPTGMSNASLNGTYIFYQVDQGFAGGPDPPNNWGEFRFFDVLRSELTFDGAGGVDESLQEKGFTQKFGDNRIDFSSGGDDDTVDETIARIAETTPSSSNDSGTYSVSSDGQFTATINGEMIDAQIGADNETAILAGTNFSAPGTTAGTTFGFAVKQGSGMTNADVAGTYLLVGWEHNFQGDNPDHWGESEDTGVSRTFATLSADGTFEFWRDEWSANRYTTNRQIDNNPGDPGDQDRVSRNRFNTTSERFGPIHGTGTYTLSPTGELSLHYVVQGESGTISAQVSANSQTIVFADCFYDATAREAGAFFAVGIKRAPFSMQPDVKLGKEAGNQKGDDLYSFSGAGQKLRIRMRKNRTSRFYFSVQNDGTDDDRIGYRAKADRRCVKPKYLTITRNTISQVGAISRIGAGYFVGVAQSTTTVRGTLRAGRKCKKRRSRILITADSETHSSQRDRAIVDIVTPR